MGETMVSLTDAIKAFQMAFKNDPASIVPTGAQLHGPLQDGSGNFGPFAAPGVRPQMYTTLVRPYSLARMLGVSKSEYTEVLLEILTGVTAGSGANAENFCGDPPEPGRAKVCQQNIPFGEYFSKDSLNVIPKTGQLRNRGEIPREVLNGGPNENPLIPDVLWRWPADSRDQLGYGLWLVGVELERSLEPVLITGSNALAPGATQPGWISEFNGLDWWIKTGFTDAISGVACPAMDSIVITFSAAITGTDAAGRTIMNELQRLVRATRANAMKFGMPEVEHVFVMRDTLFYELVDQVACNYATTRCTAGTNAAQTQDALVIEGMRQAMINGMYLEIEGRRIIVVFSDGVPETQNADGTWRSDIYYVPVRWRGQSLLNLEYFPMDNPYISKYTSFINAPDTSVINNGIFLTGKRHNGFCHEYLFASRMRLILETPFLAGRIDNVDYAANTDIRDPHPDATTRYKDGGRTMRTHDELVYDYSDQR